MMNSMQRVLTTLQHQEPDQVPLFLLTTMTGAKLLGLRIEEYFSQPKYVIEGQIRLQERYRSDCIYPFFYASLELEAFGGCTIFIENGPPNAGRPIIQNPENIDSLAPPNVRTSKPLQRVLETIRALKEKYGDSIPIVGVVISPFSLPVMQLGFDHYLILMHEQPERFERLIQINTEFCVHWANAQLQAGATMIAYYDPLSSPSNVSRKIYLQHGQRIAQNVISQIKGPTATHYASGGLLPILDDISATGTTMVGVSFPEDLGTLKARARANKLSVLGNMNGIEMRNWSYEQTESVVKKAIAAAGPGGGFILSDNHGEIPWQVPDEVLLAVREATDRWGRYPLTWAKDFSG